MARWILIALRFERWNVERELLEWEMPQAHSCALGDHVVDCLQARVARRKEKRKWKW